MLFIALFAQVYFRTGLLSWAVGIVYIIYDTALLLFVAVQTRVMRAPPLSLSAPIKVTLGVVIAAYNEATVLEATIEALRRQDVPPEEIVVADDGSVAIRLIRPGPRIDGYRIVRTGLDGSERIVVVGLQRVRPGGRVTAQPIELPPSR